VNPRKSLNQTTASIFVGNAAEDSSLEHALPGVAAEIGFHQGAGHAGERHRFDGQRQERHDALKRRDLAVAESAGPFRGP
jgi:hypothetical protein